MLDGKDADGTKLQVFACTAGNTNQQFVFNSNFSIQWKGHNKCVDLTSKLDPVIRTELIYLRWIRWQPHSREPTSSLELLPGKYQSTMEDRACF